jgi:2-oxo-3-hexenedioate decarboxylase
MAADIHAIAGEILATLGTGRQLSPFTSRPAGLTLEEGYRVSAVLNRLREARGEKRLGRKIGFTNRTIWEEYKVYAPMLGYVYDRSVHELSNTASLPLAQFAEPRIEPEIVFGLGCAPAADMDETALMSCVDWVAHGFEIVQSIFPHWQFSAADTVAANGLHGALLIARRHEIGPRAAKWQKALSGFEIDLLCEGRVVDHGHAANVLDGPLSALRHLVGLLARDANHPPLAAGEIVTTGTLTRAMPVKSGETWSTALRHCTGANPVGIRVNLTALSLQHADYAEILVDIGPMNAHRHDLIVGALLRRGRLQSWIPVERSRDSAAIGKRDHKLTFRNLHRPRV